jgi:hypothetical protein
VSSIESRAILHFSLACIIFSRIQSRSHYGETIANFFCSSEAGTMSASKQGLDERALARLAAAHPQGLTSAQIVDAFLRGGEKLSEATFRKWVQLGLLPRSRRVGRKGKHQGSLGLYPSSTVHRIAEIKRLMAEQLTIEDIGRLLRFRDDVESIDRALGQLWEGLRAAIHDPAAPEQGRYDNVKKLDEARRLGRTLIDRIAELEQRVMSPLVRAARARAFAAGTGGGAGDLL